MSEVMCARAASAPAPNGVPYSVFTGAPDLWKLMSIVWKKGTILRMWRRAGGIFIPEEKNAVTIGQFQPFCLFNVEGNVFF